MPFYCLMRSNTLTEDVAKLLSSAGCKAVGMSVESGNERIRNEILKRNLPNELVENSFRIARKYKINTLGNAMIGLPGQTIEHEFESFLFTKKLRIDAPTFTMYSPYPKTELAERAISEGILDPAQFEEASYNDRSVLTCFSKEEKEQQVRFISLGPIFYILPNIFMPIFKFLLKLRLNRVYSLIGSLFISYRIATKIFIYVIPRNIQCLHGFFMDFLWMRKASN